MAASNSRTESPSRGKMTITLHANEPDETAKVRIEVNNPELVAERVVTQLARKFPPESVVTISTGAGAATTDDDDTDSTADRMSIGGSSSQPARRQGRLRALEEVESSESLGEEGPVASQYYLVTDELDMAVPLEEGQTTVRLYDRSTLSVSPSDVYTVFYDESGHATGAARGFCVDAHEQEPLPQKKGIATFVQDYFISDELERAVPICPGQTKVFLSDDTTVSATPDEVYTVAYGSKGLALFTKSPTGGVAPGVPKKAGIAYAAIPHRVSSMTARPISSSEAVMPPKAGSRPPPNNVNVILYDNLGYPICTRTPSGNLKPEGLKGAASQLEYYWTPQTKHPVPPGRISALTDNKVTLTTGETVQVFPDDVSIFLRGPKGNPLGGFVTNRRPSFSPGTLAEVLPEVDNQPTSRHRPTKRSSAKRDQMFGGKQKPLRPEMAWAEKDDGTTSFGSGEDTDFATMKVLRRNPKAETLCRSQTYFIPDAINYAIPVLPDQNHVKLSNGDRLEVDPTSCVSVDYDFRGFPIETHFFDGRSTPWMINRSGIGAKFQDYLVHPDLLFSVPITPGQNQVILDDGTSVPVPSANIVTVFYDAVGKPVFTLTRRKIRPGLVPKPGIAATVQYLNLVDTHDGTGEQYVIPFKATQSEVRDPSDPSQYLKINRKAIVVAFFDKNRQPLYSQLVDGSLVGGGLLGSRQQTTTEDEYDDLLSDSYDLKIPYAEHARRVSLAQMSIKGSHRIPEVVKRPPTQRMESKAVSEDVSVRSRRQEIIERRIPVQQVEYIEKVVEVPEVRIVEKIVEVEQIEWQTKFVKKREIVERPVEHVKYVPKIETKIVERVIEVPQIIEVPRIEIIEQRVKVDRFVDVKKNAPVSQKINPIIRGDLPDFYEDVECLTLEPDLIPVDVFVPRLVKSRLIAIGVTGSQHQEVEVPLAHYNSLVLQMNPMFANNYEKLPMIKTTSGCFPLLPADQQVTVLAPTADEITKVLKNAGVVSRQATSTEIQKLKNLKTTNRRRKNHRSEIESDSDLMSVSDFAPRTSIIS